MKKLSNKRISELIDKAINDMNEWNNSHTIDEYVINSIRNINLIDDEKKLKDELKYWSCSSNYWIGVSALMTAYEERLDNKDEERMESFFEPCWLQSINRTLLRFRF